MNDLIIPIDNQNKRYLYEQIYCFIRDEIRVGKLRKGERLPSTRLLASQLQISRATVDSAYAQLLSEGYIETVPCKGYFVCDISLLYQLDTREETLEKGTLSFSYEEDKTSGVSSSRESYIQENAKSSWDYDFSPHRIDMNYFPFDTWKKLHKQVLLDRQENVLYLGDPKGDYSLRETICRYLHASRGVNATPEQIIIGAGNDYLLLLLTKMFAGNQRIAMEVATYQKAYQIFEKSQFEVVKAGMDSQGICIDNLEKQEANLAYVMPAHQFPTGIVMPVRRRLELLAWANAKDSRYLIEDDYDSEFRYKGKPIPALQSIDHSQKVIYMGTFSKSIAPAIRISYMVLPNKLLQSYEENCSFISSTVPRVDQAVLDAFIQGGYFERYLNKMRKIYRQKQSVFLEGLEPFEKHFIILGEEAGLHIILQPKDSAFEGGKNHALEDCVLQAKKAGIKVYRVSDNMPWNDGDNRLILGFAGLSEEQISEGLTALANIWQL